MTSWSLQLPKLELCKALQNLAKLLTSKGGNLCSDCNRIVIFERFAMPDKVWTFSETTNHCEACEACEACKARRSRYTPAKARAARWPQFSGRF